MKFYNIALAATVSAATEANLAGATTPVFAAALPATYAKYEAVEVAGTDKAAVDVTLSVKYTAAVTATNCPDTTASVAYVSGGLATPTTSTSTADQTAASKTNAVIMAVQWTGAQWKGDEAAGAVSGAGTALVAKTVAAGNPALKKAAGDDSCSASIIYTIPKDAKNVDPSANVKDAGIKMATAGYATVLAKNGKKGGCANTGTQFSCKTAAPTEAGTSAADSTDGGAGAYVEGGLGVYQAVPDSVGDFQFIWALTIKAAAGGAAADGAAADKKKSATTLAIGAAAGLVAAAIA